MFHSLVTGLPQEKWFSIPVVPVVDWLHGALSDAGVATVVLDTEGLGRAAQVRALARLIRKHRVGLVHAHLLGSGVYASLATALRRVPVVCTLHGIPDLGENDPLLPLKFRILSRSGNRIVFVSESLQQEVLRRVHVPKRSRRVVHNGIEPGAPDMSGAERSETGAGPADFLVGTVGNLRPAKDYANLLRAAAIVRDAGCPIHVAVIGQGGNELEQELLELRSSLALDSSVSFLGFRADAGRLLCAFDLFVSSSVSEGFSLSTLEALWAGVPVVATRSGGPEEIVRHGDTGVLVPVESPAALAAGILELYRSPQRAIEMAERGKTDVQTRFSRSRMLASYESIYREVVGGEFDRMNGGRAIGE
jgi:glycosyltransferase involved in cell wall biosynthesis